MHPDRVTAAHAGGIGRRAVRPSGWLLSLLALLPIGPSPGAAVAGASDPGLFTSGVAGPPPSGPAASDSGRDDDSHGVADAELLQAEAYLAAGRYDEAIASFEGLRDARPDDARVLMGLGRALTAKHRYRAADDHYRDMEERRIEPVWAHLQRAHLWVERGDLEQAEQAYRNVMQAEGDNLEARIGVARVKHLQGLNRSAREQAGNILLDHPESEAARVLLRDIDLGLRPAIDVDPVRFDDGSGGRVDAVAAAYTFMAEPQTSIRIGTEWREAGFLCTDAALCDELAGPGHVDERLVVNAWTLSAGLTSMLVAPLDFHARLGAARQETFFDDQRTVLIGGGNIRWHVGPRFRIIATADREALMDSAELTARGIRLDTSVMLLDFRFHPSWRLSGEGELGWYSDGNARQSAHAGIRWSPALDRIEFSGAFDLWYRRFHDDRDYGYFDPLRYDSQRLTIDAAGASAGEAVYWRLHGMYGRHNYDAAVTSRLMAEMSDRVHGVRATAGVRFGSRSRLEAFWFASNDPLDYAIAFDSRTYGASWRLWL